MAEEDEKTKAPHGRDEHGTPLAPFGYKTNGDPKLSNRGRAPAPPKKTTPNVKAAARPRGRSAAQTKYQLLELVGMFTTPVSAAADNPVVRKKIGDRHADAIAGDVVIVEAVAPEFIDGVMLYAERKPGMLAWMDKAEDAAPALMMVKAAATMVKAIVQNHMNPDPQLAAAGRRLASVKAARYAAAIQAEAQALGLDDANVVDIPEQRAA